MIQIDYNNVRQEVIGNEHGLDLDFEFSNYSEQIKNILQKVYSYTEVDSWFGCDYQKDIISEILEYSELVRGKFEYVNIIGLSGPVFGIKAMAQTILKPYWNFLSKEQRNGFPQFHFITNIDPDYLRGVYRSQNSSKTLFIFISKTDNEPEETALFMTIRSVMEEEIGENYRMHMVTCAKKGSLLHGISEQEGYKCFVVPYETVGNFAIMSTCGLLPLSLAGIDIKEMLAGAKDTVEYTKNPDIRQNTVAQLALIDYLLSTQKQKTVHIMTSFSSEIRELPLWCGQYRASMLSKKTDIDNKPILTEQISIASQSCNNHNALLKMVIEGKNNKIVTLVKAEKYSEDFLIPSVFNYTPIGYLGGKSFKYLLDSEIEAMKMVLTDYQCPNITITLPQITPYYVGSFIAAYMIDMVIQALLYKINPFNWVGAETLQNYICAQMGRYGYEETFKEMQEKLERFKTQQVLPEEQPLISD
ncbi:MAG: hypothetical protein K6C94_06860 [Candidatus Gastranaerophilales bacterium]|nr:hypothetical protein [Candidatus Gastranaerophilales bacterium]